jgi:hypothetical protein
MYSRRGHFSSIPEPRSGRCDLRVLRRSLQKIATDGRLPNEAHARRDT